MAFRATLAGDPVISVVSLAEYAPAPYGVRGVDFVQSKPPRFRLHFEVDIDGTPSKADLERMTSAFVSAAEVRAEDLEATADALRAATAPDEEQP